MRPPCLDASDPCPQSFGRDIKNGPPWKIAPKLSLPSALAKEFVDEFLRNVDF